MREKENYRDGSNLHNDGDVVGETDVLAQNEEDDGPVLHNACRSGGSGARVSCA